MHRIRIACFVIVLAAGTAHAGVDNAGTTAGNFLSVGTGASVLAMGGAALGVGTDLQAAAWNPAALAQLGSTQFALSHASLAQLSAQDLAAAGGRLGAGATRWGASVLYQGDGSFDGRDALGVPTGTFNVSSMALGVQVARPLGNAVTAGMGVRWLSDNLGDAKGSGLALDFGAQARAGSLGLGIAARNVGGSMSYPSGRFDLPAVVGVGTSWSDAAHGLRLALDANFPRAYYNDIRLGGEWRWQDRVALRAGYRMELGAASGEPLGGPSFGLGAGANGVWMDYAFLAGNADVQGQHRVGLTFRPGFLGHKTRSVSDARFTEVDASDLRASDAGVPPAPDAEIRDTEAGEPDAGVAVADATDTAAIGVAAEGFETAAAAPQAVARDQAAVPTTTAPPAAPAVAEPPAGAEPVVAAPVAPAPRALSVLEQLAFDVSDRLPPGGSESEVSPRDIIPLHVLAPSLPVRVAPLVVAKPSDSSSDTRDAEATLAARPAIVPATVVRPVAVRTMVARTPAPRPAVATPVVAPVVTVPKLGPPAPVRVAFVRPAGSSNSTAPVVVTRPAPAPSVVAPVAVARPAVAPSVVAPAAVARPAAAPSVVAPTAVTPVVVMRPAATRPVVAPVAVAPVAVAPVEVASAAVAPAAITPVTPPVLTVNYPVRPTRAPRVAPSPRPKPDAPEAAAPVASPDPAAAPAAAPESSAPEIAPSAPEFAPSAPPSAPEPARPAKTSPWPTVSASMPKAQFAGSSQKIAVVTLPADVPSTAPITRPVAATPRPSFVHAKGDETLADIAKRWNTSVPALMMENNLVNTTVKNGQKLILPPPLH